MCVCLTDVHMRFFTVHLSFTYFPKHPMLCTWVALCVDQTGGREYWDGVQLCKHCRVLCRSCSTLVSIWIHAVRSSWNDLYNRLSSFFNVEYRVALDLAYVGALSSWTRGPYLYDVNESPYIHCTNYAGVSIELRRQTINGRVVKYWGCEGIAYF